MPFSTTWPVGKGHTYREFLESVIKALVKDERIAVITHCFNTSHMGPEPALKSHAGEACNQAIVFYPGGGAWPIPLILVECRFPIYLTTAEKRKEVMVQVIDRLIQYEQRGALLGERMYCVGSIGDEFLVMMKRRGRLPEVVNGLNDNVPVFLDAPA